MNAHAESCSICKEKIKPSKNLAVFDCGHKHHLSCVMTRASCYDTKCPTCSEVQNLNLKPDLGDDRKIAITSAMEARIKRRQMLPKQDTGWFFSLLAAISPFKKTPQNAKDHISAGYSLSELARQGFTPDDCVQDRIPWNFMTNNASAQQLLQFGFGWKEMVSMGVKSNDLNKFTWSQIKHTLNISAKDLLKLNMSFAELAELKLSPHQLNDLGFTFDIFESMGANVRNFEALGMSIEEIKTYFTPTITQWMNTGFYDKEMLSSYGWDIATVIRVLPAMTDRIAGRQLRLTF